MRIDIVTLFPELCDSFLHASILGRAADKGLFEAHCHQIRDYTKNKQKQTDDYPYGGGCGMVLYAQPIADCIRAVQAQCAEQGRPRPHVAFLTAAGAPYNEQTARRLATYDSLILVCGHYEGIDERVIEAFGDEEISIGDYVRKPDGELEEQVENRVLIKDRHPLLGVPFIRGVFNFCSSLANGVKALMFSASFLPEDEEEPEEPSRFELWLDRRLGSEKAASFFVTAAVALGIIFAVVLFILLPTAITGLIGLVVPLPMWLRNLLEGVVKVVIFVGYLILCSRMKDIHRVFQYHGAEHKTIFCYEHGLPLTVENVRIQPRHHPRCGTSFLFVVIVVSILLSSLLFSFIEVTNTFARMGLHLLLLPVIVSLTYEFNRLVGRYDNWFTRIMTAPGLWLQNWTTFEPDDSMIEVGIRAFTLVLPEEKGKDAW